MNLTEQLFREIFFVILDFRDLMVSVDLFLSQSLDIVDCLIRTCSSDKVFSFV